MLPESAPVLLVDDNPDDRLILARCWAKAGIRHPLVDVEDGQKAIDHLSASSAPNPVGLVLLDLKMPVRNGFEVLAWIRADPTWRRLPVIVLTASSQPADVDRAFELGANAYLVKPSSVDELVEVLSALKRFWLANNEFPRQRP